VVLEISVSGAERHQNNVHFMFLTLILCTLILVLLKNFKQRRSNRIKSRRKVIFVLGKNMYVMRLRVILPKVMFSFVTAASHTC